MHFASAELAQRRFEELSQLEPRLTSLWQQCRGVAPPMIEDVEDDDADDPPVDEWCAEDHFLQHIKPRLVELVGWDRVEDPDELRGREAYDAAYAALFSFALNRSCCCCREEHA